MDFDPIFVLVVTIFFIIGFMISYMSNIFNRAKMWRRMRKKNYGVIMILTKGKSIVEFMQDLSAPIYTFRSFTIDPQKQNPYAVYSINEVPVMFYYDVDANPIVLEGNINENQLTIQDTPLGKLIPHQSIPILLDPSIKQKIATFNSDPNALYAAFQAYSELIRKQMAMKLVIFQILLFACIGGILIIGYLVYNQGNDLGSIATTVKAIQAQITAMNVIKTIPTV